MASLNLAGKTSGYVKLKAPDDSSSNPTVTLPTESGELALKGKESLWTEEDGKATYDGDIQVNNNLTVGRGNGSVNNNTLIGANSLLNNTTGASNTVIGQSSFAKNTEGNNNVVVGAYSVQNNVTGDANVAVGNASLQNSTGNMNTAIGYSAGSTITSGGNNTCIGTNAQPSSPTVSNEVTIGDANVTRTELKGDVRISPAGAGGSIIVSGGINAPTLETATANTTPLGITAEGWFYRTPTTYSAEEVDKKLAVKDKLIEKLSERLDKLEKKLKK